MTDPSIKVSTLDIGGKKINMLSFLILTAVLFCHIHDQDGADSLYSLDQYKICGLVCFESFL